MARPHGAERMKLGGGDSDLCPEAELAAVVEAGRRVHEHAAGIDFAKPSLRMLVAACADGLGVAGAKLGHVRERLVDAVDHRTARIFSRNSCPKSAGDAGVALGMRATVRGQPRSSTFFSAAIEARSREECAGLASVNEETLERVANTGADRLAVDDQADREFEIAARIGEQMTDSLVMLNHRHPRVLGHEAYEPLAAPRDDQIDETREAQHSAHRFAIAGGTICTASAGSPASSSPAWSRRPSAALDFAASEPPRKSTALPLLMHRAAASIVTFGRAS